MLADDRDYLSWMARAALAVVMVIVMSWIRSEIPDEPSTARTLPIHTAMAGAEPTTSSVLNTQGRAGSLDTSRAPMSLR